MKSSILPMNLNIWHDVGSKAESIKTSYSIRLYEY